MLNYIGVETLPWPVGAPLPQQAAAKSIQAQTDSSLINVNGPEEEGSQSNRGL